MRPVNNPVMGIDWVLFRENIEGEYIWGSKGIQVDEDLAIDFRVQTKLQSRHVARTAFEYARKSGRKHVTAVSKVNVVKLTDGNFLAACREVAKDYPEIAYNELLVDITASKLGDKEFTKDMEVLVLPNLYGDIISDVAAELSGGVGTAGSHCHHFEGRRYGSDHELCASRGNSHCYRCQYAVQCVYLPEPRVP